jgi:hypothetical protein
MKKLLPVLIALIVLAGTACAPATPTVDAAQIQASAVAAASTMVAMTQQAVPPPTEVPPTPLPMPTALPSPTLLALPTLPFLAATAAPAPTTSSDTCNAPMAAHTDGPVASVRIANETSGDVVLSLYLHKTSFGECGYRGFNISPHGSITVPSLPQGCYFAGAFVTTPKLQTKSFGNGCVNGDKGTVVIGPEVITISSN